MQYNVTINKEECLGCGACTNSDNWEIDSEGKANPIKSIISEAELASNKEAEDICPIDVIKIEKIV